MLLNQAVSSNLLPAPRLDRNRVVATMRDVATGSGRSPGSRRCDRTRLSRARTERTPHLTRGIVRGRRALGRVRGKTAGTGTVAALGLTEHPGTRTSRSARPPALTTSWRPECSLAANGADDDWSRSSTWTAVSPEGYTARLRCLLPSCPASGSVATSSRRGQAASSTPIAAVRIRQPHSGIDSIRRWRRAFSAHYPRTPRTKLTILLPPVARSLTPAARSAAPPTTAAPAR